MASDRERISTRRMSVVLLSAVVLVFAAMNAAVAQTLGTRLFQLAICVWMGYWLLREWKAGLELAESELIVHDGLRARLIPWTELASARLERRSRKELWFARRWPRVVLAVYFDNGGTKQFEGVSAPESDVGPLGPFVEEIRRRIRAAKLPS